MTPGEERGCNTHLSRDFSSGTCTGVEGIVLETDDQATVFISAPGSRLFTWILVLVSRGVDHRVVETRGLRRIEIARADLDSALEEIIAFEEENRGLDHAQGVGVGAPSLFLPIAALFFVPMALLMAESFRDKALALGMGSSTLIAQGQWWRCVTALFLHSDPAHLASNMIAGTGLVWLLSREEGAGLSWFVAVTSGGLGNLLNSMVTPEGYRFLGFSTAVMGVAGAVSTLRLSRPGRKTRWWVGVGAGMALLAFTGAGTGGRVDVTGHLMGFLAGMAVGPVVIRFKGLVSGRRLLYDRILACMAVILPVIAWAAVLSR